MIENLQYFFIGLGTGILLIFLMFAILEYIERNKPRGG